MTVPHNPFKIIVPTILLHPAAKVPTRSSTGAAGHDICCVGGCDNLTDPHNWGRGMRRAWAGLARLGFVVIPPGRSFLFRTGIIQAIPPGYVGLLWDRGSMGAMKEIHRLAGVIDDDYRGEWFVRLVNHNKVQVRINEGSKIAQVVYQRYAVADCPVVASFDEEHDTARGTGAFGSTDVAESDDEAGALLRAASPSAPLAEIDVNAVAVPLQPTAATPDDELPDDFEDRAAEATGSDIP